MKQTKQIFSEKRESDRAEETASVIVELFGIFGFWRFCWESFEGWLPNRIILFKFQNIYRKFDVRSQVSSHEVFWVWTAWKKNIFWNVRNIRSLIKRSIKMTLSLNGPPKLQRMERNKSFLIKEINWTQRWRKNICFFSRLGLSEFFSEEDNQQTPKWILLSDFISKEYPLSFFGTIWSWMQKPNWENEYSVSLMVSFWIEKLAKQKSLYF